MATISPTITPSVLKLFDPAVELLRDRSYSIGEAKSELISQGASESDANTVVNWVYAEIYMAQTKCRFDEAKHALIEQGISKEDAQYTIDILRDAKKSERHSKANETLGTGCMGLFGAGLLALSSGRLYVVVLCVAILFLIIGLLMKIRVWFNLYRD